MIVEITFKGRKPVFKYKKIKGREPYPPVKLMQLKQFVRAYYRYIVHKWETSFIFGSKVKFEKVKDLTRL
jgi:hypothetical protein